ncbi:MAG: OB-fold nucleic acid binding domain-containing protein, partial [Rhodoplanes sp.]
LGEHVVADYRHLHLSLKAHPAAFLRGDFDRRGILRNERLAALPSSRRVSVAGIVLVRQRPGTAKGVIFMTLEDETGVANAIVWPQVFETFRPIVLGARLVCVSGRLQNESGVIHVVADRLDDLTPLLQRLATDAGCIDTLARCDEVKRPIPENRIPLRAGSSLAALLRGACPHRRNRARRQGPRRPAQGPQFSLDACEPRLLALAAGPRSGQDVCRTKNQPISRKHRKSPLGGRL